MSTVLAPRVFDTPRPPEILFVWDRREHERALLRDVTRHYAQVLEEATAA